jgi:hypothetical protein
MGVIGECTVGHRLAVQIISACALAAGLLTTVVTAALFAASIVSLAVLLSLAIGCICVAIAGAIILAVACRIGTDKKEEGPPVVEDASWPDSAEEISIVNVPATAEYMEFVAVYATQLADETEHPNEENLGDALQKVTGSGFSGEELANVREAFRQMLNNREWYTFSKTADAITMGDLRKPVCCSIMGSEFCRLASLRVSFLPVVIAALSLMSNNCTLVQTRKCYEAVEDGEKRVNVVLRQCATQERYRSFLGSMRPYGGLIFNNISSGGQTFEDLFSNVRPMLVCDDAFLFARYEGENLVFDHGIMGPDGRPSRKCRQ